MDCKAKGTKGERELVRLFNEAGWGCIRIAGSGSGRYPSPDILAGNAIRRLAIECKVTKEQKKYFSEDEIEQLSIFSRNFGAESWIGIHYPNESWYFIMIEDMDKTNKGWAASLGLVKKKGLTIDELMGNDKKFRNI